MSGRNACHATIDQTRRLMSFENWVARRDGLAGASISPACGSTHP